MPTNAQVGSKLTLSNFVGISYQVNISFHVVIESFLCREKITWRFYKINIISSAVSRLAETSTMTI